MSEADEPVPEALSESLAGDGAEVPIDEDNTQGGGSETDAALTTGMQAVDEHDPYERFGEDEADEVQIDEKQSEGLRTESEIVESEPESRKEDLQRTDSVSSEVTDSDVADSDVADTGVADSGITDSGITDSGITDSGITDSGITDSDDIDSGIADLATADESSQTQALPASVRDEIDPILKMEDEQTENEQTENEVVAAVKPIIDASVEPRVRTNSSDAEMPKRPRHIVIRSATENLMSELKIPRDFQQAIIDDGRFNDQMRGFREQRVMLVSCADSFVLHELRYQVGEYLKAQGVSEIYRCRMPGEPLQSDDSATDASVTFRFQNVLYWHQEPHNRSRSVASFVSIRDQLQLDSVLAWCRDIESADTQHSLRTHKHFCACFVYPESKESLLEIKHQFENVFIWHVDFLEPVLRFYADTGTDMPPPEDLAELINKSADWSRGERDLHRQVMNFFPRPKQRGQGYRDLVTYVREKKTPSKDVEVEKHVVRNAIYFIMAFFNELSVKDFGLLMNILLADEEHFIEEEETIADEPEESIDPSDSDDTKERQPKIIKTVLHKVPVPAIELWDKSGDDFLDECGVQAQVSAHEERGGERVYCFSKEFPKRAELLKELIESKQSQYHMRQFDKIFKSRLLFEPKTSENLCKQLISLSADMAHGYQDTFGEDWLEHMIDSEPNPMKVSMRAVGDTIHLVARQFPKRSIFYDRLGRLCRQLLDQDSTRSAVDRLFGRLLSTASESAEGPQIAWSIARQLQESPSFDYYTKLNKILCMARLDVRLNIQRHLLQKASAGPIEYAAITRELSGWLDDDPGSMSLKYALSFIFDYFNATFHHYFSEEERPDHHPIFHQQIEDIDSLISCIVTWVTHPHLGAAVNAVQCDLMEKEFNRRFSTGWSSMYVITDIVEGSKEIAEDIKERIGDAQPDEAVNKLIHELIQNLNSAERSEICEHLRKRRDLLREEREKSGRSKVERRNLKRRIDRVISLRRKFSKKSKS